jgi:hypothetical protein
MNEELNLVDAKCSSRPGGREAADAERTSWRGANLAVSLNILHSSIKITYELYSVLNDKVVEKRIGSVMLLISWGI